MRSYTRKNLPILIEISPIAQVALLQTEMNSGFRFAAKIGIKSAVYKEMEMTKFSQI